MVDFQFEVGDLLKHNPDKPLTKKQDDIHHFLVLEIFNYEDIAGIYPYYKLMCVNNGKIMDHKRQFIENWLVKAA
jgi:hypothetical protein